MLSFLNGDFLFNWMRTLEKCPSPVLRFTATVRMFAVTICVLFSCLLTLLPPPAEAKSLVGEERLAPTTKAEFESERDAERLADLTALELAFRGYVAIVFPVGVDTSCMVRETGVERRFRDAYRSWYEVQVVAKCPKTNEENYAIWFLCSKRNGLQCALIAEPVDQNEMRP